jgi:Ca2+-binding RTX toxin-like protein
MTRAALLALLTSALLLAVGASPAPAPAQGTLTTLFTTMTTPAPTATGINSVPVGPTDLGTFRAAMAFTPTVSGQAQLLSMRGRCVLIGNGGTACANIGRVSLQSDAAGKPSGQELGSMGFYLLEDAEKAWRLELTGNPTGGTFRLRYQDADVTNETGPIPFDVIIDCRACPQTTLKTLMRKFGKSDWPSFMTTGRLPQDVALFRIPGQGSVTAFDVQLTGGTNPNVSLTQPVIQQECGTLSPTPELKAGTKYWAVMTAEDEAGWSDWTDDTAEVLESLDDGPWQTAFNPKTLALRIDSGYDSCVPVAVANPDPGTGIGPGTERFNTVTITNKGVSPLTLGGASFTGPGAAVFSLLDAEPGPLARPYRFPRSLGVETTSIFYVACSSAAEGLFRATLSIKTSDPSLPEVGYPVECLVDRTPPTVAFSPGVPDGLADWWRTSPVTLGVTASDPQPGSSVTHLFCSDANTAALWSPWSVFGSAMSSSITGEGVHDAGCRATDEAGNTSGNFATGFKIDSRPPVAVATVAPPPNDDGWSNAETTVSFACDDPVPGSGVDTAATGGGSVDAETAGTDFTSGGCTDVAGLAATPVTVPVKIDWTAPALDGSGTDPAPNGAGWNNSDVSVAFRCTDGGDVQSGVVAGWPDVVITDETPERIVEPTGDCIDAAGNKAVLDGSESVTVRLDRTNPTTELDGKPSAAANVDTAAFDFHGEDALSGVDVVECRLDGSAFAECAGDSKTYSDLADGDHTFDARAVDLASNEDGSPASWTWTVDTVEPDTSVDSGPDAVTSSTSASLRYSGDALGGTAVRGYECRLDDAAFAACGSSGETFSDLSAGEHTFEVRAVDEAGNADPSPASATWTVDLTAPQTTITGRPDPKTLKKDATFVFEAVDSGGSSVAGIECRLDDAAFAPCTSPVELAELLPGRHAFEVRASDRVGNVEAPPVAFSWLVSSVLTVDDNASALEDTPTVIPVAGNDAIPSGTPVTIAATGPTSARGGTVASAGDGSFRYVPPADFNGLDSFTYTASADGVTADPATVTVSVAAVNDAPVFSPGGEVSVDEDSGAYSASWASTLGVGPADESGQHARFVLAADTALFSAGPAISPDGRLTFTPTPNANGRVTIDVALVDDGGIANGGTDMARSALTITIRPIEDAPRITVARAFECGGASGRLNILVDDVDTANSALSLSPSASNGQIGVAAAGAGSNRSLTLTGLRRSMRATLTVGVSDGALSASTSIPILVGTNRGETIDGSSGPDVLFGRGGRDTLRGADGNDMICGGTGSDRIDGGAGDDVLLGGAGNDVIRGAEGDDVLRGGWGADLLFGGPGDDILRGGRGADRFAAAPGNDQLLDLRSREGDRR